MNLRLTMIFRLRGNELRSKMPKEKGPTETQKSSHYIHVS
jgi:hypothetical protein